MVINYYHQGNTSSSAIGEYEDDKSKIGLNYRTEVYDDSGNLYSKSIKKWDKYEIDSDHDFVKLIRNTSFTYDGDTDHREKAVTYSYNNDNGNKIQEINWGEVSGLDDGSFTDIGSDMASSTIEYAASSTIYLLALPSRELIEDQNNNKVKEIKYYYDNLALGEVSVGNNTKIEYWEEGNDYIDTERTYNSYGLVTAEKDPRDKITNYTYDSYNLYVATSTNALSQATDYYYDYSSGKVKKTIDANGNVFELVYDGLDRIIEEKQTDIDNPNTLVSKASYVYNDSDSVRSIEKKQYLDTTTNIDSYTYLDGLDRVIQERVEAEDTDTYSIKDYAYNELGLLASESLQYFGTGTTTTVATTSNEMLLSYDYDPLQRISSLTNAVGTTTYAYDDWQIVTTDAAGNEKSIYYDAYGNLVQVDENNDSNTYTTDYDYDLFGNLTQIEDDLGNVRNFSYNGLNRLIVSEDLHAYSDTTFASTSYSYDDAGNLVQKIDGKNQTINYTYDDLNRVLTEDYLGDAGTEVEYEYDTCTNGVGRLCTATSSASVINYAYNALGLLSSEAKNINTNIFNTSYSYDRLGNITKVVYPDEMEVEYSFNDGGQIESVAKKEAGEASFVDVVSDFDYNPLGQVLYEEYANGVHSDYFYDADELYRLKNKTTILSDTGAKGGFEDMFMIAGLSGNNIITKITPEIRDFYNRMDKLRKEKKEKIVVDKERSKKAIEVFEAAKKKEKQEKGILENYNAVSQDKIVKISEEQTVSEEDGKEISNIVDYLRDAHGPQYLQTLFAESIQNTEAGESEPNYLSSKDIVENIIGTDFVSAYYYNDGEYFSINSEDNISYNISDFDYLIIVKDRSPKFNDSDYRYNIIEEKAEFEISKNNEVIISYNFNEFIEKIMGEAEYDDNYIRDLDREKMIITGENEQISYELHLNTIGGRKFDKPKDENNYKDFYLDGVLLIKEK